jgi:hypothetical protein
VVTLDEKLQRAQVEDVKEEWRLLWSRSVDDKVRAEGLASESFPLLHVEQGTIIKATRDFKPLDLKEILRLQKVQDVEQVLGPCPSVGGYTKFAKEVLNKQSRTRRFTEELPKRKSEKNMQQKHSGRGWLHL